MTDADTQWTVETLKEMVDQRFLDNQKAVDTALLAQEKAVNAALLAAKEAVGKAEILTDRRFDAVTLTVAQVSKQTVDLLPRAEYGASHNALNDKIISITDAINRSSGDKNLYATTSYVTQIVSQSIDTLEAKMVAILTPLTEYITAQKGATISTKSSTDNVFKLIAAVSAIFGILGMLVGVVLVVSK